MKQFWIAIAILAAIFIGSMANTWILHNLTTNLTATLAQAEELARHGDINGAIEKTEKAQKQWKKNTGYLYAVLRHAETDTVEVLFMQTLEYLKDKDSAGEYMATNQSLIAQIKLLHEMEELNIKNVL
ncbi:MAG: DUF4363 family protein [Oscillospiraceae bacterium]|nr:DUF4363 family protein [Oscillospiraceae bacterium]